MYWKLPYVTLYDILFINRVIKLPIDQLMEFF